MALCSTSSLLVRRLVFRSPPESEGRSEASPTRLVRGRQECVHISGPLGTEAYPWRVSVSMATPALTRPARSLQRVGTRVDFQVVAPPAGPAAGSSTADHKRLRWDPAGLHRDRSRRRVGGAGGVRREVSCSRSQTDTHKSTALNRYFMLKPPTAQTVQLRPSPDPAVSMARRKRLTLLALHGNGGEASAHSAGRQRPRDRR